VPQILLSSFLPSLLLLKPRLLEVAAPALTDAMAASLVHYQFANASKIWNSISFENSSISVIDLKRAILIKTKLNNSPDNFDLSLKNAQTGEGTVFRVEPIG
jgi:hypothetical protein